jgi:hypothetical protein
MKMPVPVAGRFKARVSGRSLAGIGGSNPAEGMDACCGCCVLSGRGLCDGPIPHPEEYLVIVMCHCVWFRNLKNETALARLGLFYWKKPYFIFIEGNKEFSPFFGGGGVWLLRQRKK